MWQKQVFCDRWNGSILLNFRDRITYTIFSRLTYVQQKALTCTIAKKLPSSKPGQVGVKYSFDERDFL